MKVIEFPTDPCDDIPAMAQTFAVDVSKGEYGKINAVLVIMDTEDGLIQFGWGRAAGDCIQVIGLLETAKHAQLSGDFG